jgi:phosphoglycolate phosphatase
MAAPTVVFDLDGTLIDTAPDLVDTLNIVFTSEGIPPIPFAAARNLIGSGARVMIERALEAEGRPLIAGEIDRLVRHFIAHYTTHIADRSRPFPGLEAALEWLAARGCLLAVCTNKLEGLSVLLLDALGLSKYFAAVCGQDTLGLQKPNPEMLRQTILRAGGRPDHAVMVGDSAIDIHTARAAGIPVVAVEFGYTEIPVTKLGPDRIIGHFNELPAAVTALVDLRQAPA